MALNNVVLPAPLGPNQPDELSVFCIQVDSVQDGLRVNLVMETFGGNGSTFVVCHGKTTLAG